MSHKIVSQLDVDGYLVGPTQAFESPLEKGIFLIPAGAINVHPVDVPEGQRAKWVDGAWVFEELPQTAEEAAVEEVIVDPVDKLKSFLLANPDVATLLAGQ